MSADKPTVLVTGIGGGGVGEQVLKALRLAGGYRIVGADVHSDVPQFALVDEAYILPLANHLEYVEAVISLARNRKISVVFYGSEAELRVMSAARSQFEDAGIYIPLNPGAVINTCMDKVATARFLEARGLPGPRSMSVATIDDVEQIDWFPVVVKPSAASGGSRDVFIAQTINELSMIVEYLAGKPLIVQEYVGRPDAEYTVGVLHGGDGAFINSIGVRRRLSSQLNIRSSAKNMTNRSDLGPDLVISSGISHGEVGRFPEVTEQCEAVAAALGATSAVNIQCRLVGDQVFVFEINPRFSGTTSLRALVGYNEPDVLIRRDVLGESIEPRFPYQEALVLRSLIETVVPPRSIPDWRQASP